MREEFEKMAAAGKLERHHIESLVQLTNSGFCMHRSWGFGRIKTVDTVFARFTIDFPNKPGHAMDLAFAAESLKPIPKEHILARKAADLEGLRQLAATNHLELVKMVLNSFGGKATQDQIQQALVPDVIRDDWKKWWEAAKRELKKDGHFQVPLKKTEPIIYQVKEISLQDRLMEEFRAAKGLKARLLIASELLKSAHDLADKKVAAAEVIVALNTEIPSYQRTQPAVALEAIFARDDIRAMAELSPGEGEIEARAIWSQDLKLGPLMEQLKETVARLVSQHTASTELLLWLAKDRNDSFADILGPEVFRAMLTSMERDQFNERRSNRLRDFIIDDQDLLVELIGSADLEVIKDLTRALQLSPCFDDMDKRSLLARIVKSYPAVQSLISGDHKKEEGTFIVSWESLERRKEEYSELVQKKIPANSKEIAVARSYGDLRENHEYKAAKEMQKLLMRRKSELEAQLVRARGTDFANAKTDAVSIGTIVRAVDLKTNQPAQFTILGAWDSDPEKGLVSYLSPMAQSLLNRKVGDEVEFEIHGVVHRHRIEAIEPYKTGAPTPTPSAAPAEPVASA